MPTNVKSVISANLVKRTMREVAHKVGSSRASHNDEARMVCAAVPPGENPKDIVVAFSGHIGRITDGPAALDPYPHLLRQYEAKLPWRGLTAPPNRAYSTCAEAHVWLDLCARAKDPRNYYLVSFNNFGEIANPCHNCAQWVDRAFALVHRETRAYEGHPKQKPGYR